MAAALWHQGKFKEAATLLRAAVQSDPDFAMAHAALGSDYFSYIVNAPVEGKQEYEKALALSSRTTDRERLLIQVSYADDLEHVSDADALYRAYLSRYPDDWTILSNYARLLRRHGRAPEAIAQYKEIIRVAPDDARTYIEMATAYRTLNQLPEALTAYAEAIQLDPALACCGRGRERIRVCPHPKWGGSRKRSKSFTGMTEKPETRESGTRSLAMLDMYHGRYANAAEALRRVSDQPAESTGSSKHGPCPSLARHPRGWPRGTCALSGENSITLSTTSRRSDQRSSLARGMGRQYVSAGALDKAEKLESSRSPHSRTPRMLSRPAICISCRERLRWLGDIPTKPSNCSLFQTRRTAHPSASKLSRAPINKKERRTMPSPGTKSSWGCRTGQSGGRPSNCGWRLIARSRLIIWPRGDREKARQTIGQLLDLWKDADPELPLRKQAKARTAS